MRESPLSSGREGRQSGYASDQGDVIRYNYILYVIAVIHIHYIDVIRYNYYISYLNISYLLILQAKSEISLSLSPGQGPSLSMSET